MNNQNQNYVNCHWFQGSFTSNLMPVLRDAIESFYRDTFMMAISWEAAGGLNGYQSSLRYGEKIKLLFDDNKDYAKRIHNDKACVIFDGDFFDSLPFDKLPEFARMVGFVKVTRFDQYYQDSKGHIDVSGVYQAYKNGCCRGFKAFRHIEGGSNAVTKGETLELGHRGSSGSGKFLRIYDKEMESEGKIQGVRWELEWSGKRAVTAWEMWKKNEFSASSCAGFIFSTVDWIEPTNDQHKSRWQRLAWYSLLIDSADTTLAVPVEIPKTNVEKKDKWLKHSVSGTLAYMRAFLYFTGGFDAYEKQMDSYLKEGKMKLSKALLIQLQQDIEKYDYYPDFVGTPTIKEIREYLSSLAA